MKIRKAKTVIQYLVEYTIIFIVVAIGIIVILALLGPSVSNVFSNIGGGL